MLSYILKQQWCLSVCLLLISYFFRFLAPFSLVPSFFFFFTVFHSLKRPRSGISWMGWNRPQGSVYLVSSFFFFFSLEPFSYHVFFFLALIFFLGPFFSLFFLFLTDSGHGQLFEKTPFWDFMDGMKLPPRGQFTWSVVFFFFPLSLFLIMLLFFLALTFFLGLFFSLFFLFLTDSGHGQLFEKTPFWDFMDGMKLPPKGQFTWSVVFFFSLERFSYHVFFFLALIFFLGLFFSLFFFFLK